MPRSLPERHQGTLLLRGPTRRVPGHRVTGWITSGTARAHRTICQAVDGPAPFGHPFVDSRTGSILRPSPQALRAAAPTPVSLYGGSRSHVHSICIRSPTGTNGRRAAPGLRGPRNAARTRPHTTFVAAVVSRGSRTSPLHTRVGFSRVGKNSGHRYKVLWPPNASHTLPSRREVSGMKRST